MVGIKRTLYLAPQFLPAFRVVSITDRLNEKILEALFIEYLAQNVEHPAAEGFTLNLKFLE